MNEDEIKQRYKQVEDEVNAMANQLEQDLRNKNAAIRDDTIKKVSSAFGTTN